MLKVCLESLSSSWWVESKQETMTGSHSIEVFWKVRVVTHAHVHVHVTTVHSVDVHTGYVYTGTQCVCIPY